MKQYLLEIWGRLKSKPSWFLVVESGHFVFGLIIVLGVFALSGSTALALWATVIAVTAVWLKETIFDIKIRGNPSPFWPQGFYDGAFWTFGLGTAWVLLVIAGQIC